MTGPILAVIVRNTGGSPAADGWVLDDPDGTFDLVQSGPVLGAIALSAAGSASERGVRILISAHPFVGHNTLLHRARDDDGQPHYRCENPCAHGPIPAALLSPLGGAPARLYCAAETLAPEPPPPVP